MCQACVDEGHMTAEELARRLSEDDRSVMALATLEPADFMREVAKACIGNIMTGMDPELAVELAKELVAIYVLARPMHEATLADFLVKLDSI